jgi:ribulose-phosphate 3-epimerase
MSVNPGFGAQKFISGALRKIESLAQIRERRGLSFRIEVDGGIDLTTVGDVVRAGADLLVAGNAVFAHGDVRDNARKLLQAARGATAMRA